MRHITDVNINLLHPDDYPPPHGVKMILYMHPWGTLVVGQWQHSGASLWAPLPRVGVGMKVRLDRELQARRVRALTQLGETMKVNTRDQSV